MRKLTGTAVALALVFATPIFAQEAMTIEVAESVELGQYLTNAEGRPLYRFTTDVQAVGDQPAGISCTTEECLDAWPLATTSGDPEAGEGAEASLLGTTEYNDVEVLTYGGWPLYYSASDEGADAPQGNEATAFGGEWALASPVVQVEADLAAGETMYAQACAQCHGRTARGMASFPSLAGHDAGYISTRLMQYRAGETVGPNSPLMKPVAATLSDQDIANLAAFISTEFQ